MIRKLTSGDWPRWRELFDDYTRFYQREPSEPLSRRTWERILDPASPIDAIAAENHQGRIVGIANYLLHESTSALAPVCYLQDLFVDPRERAAGVGRELIDWLIAEMKTEGWARLYWHTKENNYRARGLYDRYALQSGFVRYAIDNPR